jgi:NitT/TauT family transport system substrate-binding protein
VNGLALAGAASALGHARELLAAEPAPETTRIRLSKTPTACLAPQYVAAELLRAEGFERIEYVEAATGGLPLVQVMASGKIDVSMNYAATYVTAIDEGLPVTLLAGVHVGCFELFVSEKVRTFSDLKGKAAAILAPRSSQHILLASIATSIGLDPNRDIQWATHPANEAKALLAAGKIDAFLGFPPDAQELRAKRIGRVLLNSATDRPWSQYFCCMVAANTEFARKHPVAAKRAVRAILKASEICASSPEMATKAFVAQGFKMDLAYAEQAVRELPFGKWRDYNPEETVRFYALRLREAGMVKGSPQKLIAQGTDWRSLNELKKELKS